MSAAPFPVGSQVRLPDDTRACVIGAGHVASPTEEEPREVRIVQQSDEVQVWNLDQLREFVPQGIRHAYSPIIGVRVLDGRIVGADVDWAGSADDEGRAYDLDLATAVRLGYPQVEERDALVDGTLLGFDASREPTAVEQANALRRIADLIDGDQSFTRSALRRDLAPLARHVDAALRGVGDTAEEDAAAYDAARAAARFLSGLNAPSDDDRE